MTKPCLISKVSSVFALSAAVLLQSCGGGSLEKIQAQGELTGVLDRQPWQQMIPFGMVVCPSGVFHMGQGDEDVTGSKIAMNKQVTIGAFFMDETEITNNEYRQFETAFKDDSVSSGDWDEERYMKEIFPDTTVWRVDFTYHYGDPMEKYYYAHPAFDEYPVVGVNWHAARKFCEWRTQFLNTYREGEGLPNMPDFRLPSEAEWEYAARGGRDMAKYPWGGPYTRNAKGCVLANFKPGRGNYYDDGFQYTSPVGSYFGNDFGLYDMAGNVAEWCEDAFYPSSVPVVWDLNPVYRDPLEPRKLIRGGSWKDIAFYNETGTRTFEFEDSARSFVGFRCVMTYLGRSSGFEF